MTMTPDVRNFADSLSMLKNFTTFVLKRKDNGMEEGLVFLQLKNKEDTTVRLDEFVLERPNHATDNGNVNQSSKVADPQFTKIKGVNNNNHEISTPHLMLPVNLPPTLSITFNPCTSTSTCLTPATPTPSPVMSNSKLSKSVSGELNKSQPRSSARLRQKSNIRIRELSGQQEGSWGCNVNEAVAGGKEGDRMCTIRAVVGKRRNLDMENRDDQDEFCGKDENKSKDQNTLKQSEEIGNTAIDPEEVNTNDEKLYSNNLADSIKTVCKVCQRTVKLVGMRSHTRNCHKISITEYTEKYGNPRAQMIKPIFYHKCGICSKEMLLDADTIHSHLQTHKVSLKEYSNKFLVYCRKIDQNQNKNKEGKPAVNQNLKLAKVSMQSKFESAFKGVNTRRSEKVCHPVAEKDKLPRKIAKEENFTGMQTRLKRRKLNSSDKTKKEIPLVNAVINPLASPIKGEFNTRNKDDVESKEEEKMVISGQHQDGFGRVINERERVVVDDGAQNIGNHDKEHVQTRNKKDHCHNGHVQDVLANLDGSNRSFNFLSCQSESGNCRTSQSRSQDATKKSLLNSHNYFRSYNMDIDRYQGDTTFELAVNGQKAQGESDRITEKSVKDENVYSDGFQDKILSSISVAEEAYVTDSQERDKEKRSPPAEESCLHDVTNRKVGSQMVSDSMASPRTAWPPSPRPVPAVATTPINTDTMCRKLLSPQPATPPPVSIPHTARVSFTMKAQGSLVTSQQGKLVCTLAMKPKAPLWKGMVAFGKKLVTTNLEDLEFYCNGQVLDRFQRVEDVEGCTVLVRMKNDI